MVTSVLKTSGYQGVDPETPAHAISLFDAHPALDLLVTDVVMPEPGGCELAARMRQKQPGLKVLFMSGYAPNGIPGSLESGPSFLQKPFLLTELIACVKRMLK
jgi:two-component system cell cycle sensor histidine kinase/response regulator CckA